jgi:hypothetical protein
MPFTISGKSASSGRKKVDLSNSTVAPSSPLELPLLTKSHLQTLADLPAANSVGASHTECDTAASRDDIKDKHLY